MATHKLIMIHGMGKDAPPDEQYEKLEPLIRKKLNDNSAFKFVKVDWHEVTQLPERKLLDLSFPDQSILDNIQNVGILRDFMIYYIGDVVAYTAEPDNKNGIRKRVWEQIKNHCIENPYSLICHSLGSVIAFDYLFKLFKNSVPLYSDSNDKTSSEQLHQMQNNFRHLFTFGSPIGLFMMRQGTLWKEGSELFKTIYNPVQEGHSWLNFYDKQDPFAYPLASLFALNDKNVNNIEDIVVDTGDFIKNSHEKYWQNKRMAERIASVLTAES